MGLIHGNNIGGGGGGAGADEKAKVSSNDTTAGYLNGKLVAGTNITFTENNDGGDETLSIDATDTGKEIAELVKDPTGFPNRTDSTISFDDGTRTFTIAPVGASFSIYVNGEETKFTTAKTVTITDTEGLWFIYFNNGTLTASQTPWTFDGGTVFVALVYWDATNNSAIGIGDERHGFMPHTVHEYFHNNFGAVYTSGMTPSVTVDEDGSLDTHCQIASISAGVMYDEDIKFTHPEQTTYEMWYKTGADGYWRKEDVSSAAVAITGTRPDYNEFTGGAWQRTEVDNNKYTLTHIFATNDINKPYILVMGETEYNSKSDAQAGAKTEVVNIVTGSLPIAEFVSVGTVIVSVKDSYTNSYNAILVSTDEGLDFVDFRTSEKTGVGAPISDHGNLTGLGDDDHTQYALSCTNQFAVTDYTFDGTEVRNGGYAVNTSTGNKTINIDADLFSTGFEVSICKFTADANTVTVDAQAGNTIDGAQTYVLTKAYETITLIKDGSNKWVIKASHIGKPSDFATPSGSETLTNKTIDGDSNTISNLDIGKEVDWAAADDVSNASAFESGDKVLIYEAGVGMRKVDYDDLPSGGSGATQLSELSDVGVTTPTDKNVLVADGDSWESRALVEADISDFGSYLESETDPVVGAVNGIVKANGAGVISAATENTDYQGVPSEGAFADGDKSKLDGIETGADVTDETNVKAALDGATITNATVAASDKILFQDADDADNLKQDDAQSLANLATPEGTAIKSTGEVGGSKFLREDGDGTCSWQDVPAGGTVDVVSNVATSTILGRVTAGSGDSEELTAAQVRTLLNVEDGADVTDATNVTAAGALMDSEVTNLAQVKAFDSGDYATAAQGALADSAQQPPVEGAFVDGDKTKLDGIEALADVTDATNVGSAMTGATAKTTPVDADTVPINDSAASNVLKKVTWANVKATLKTYFDSLYAASLGADDNYVTDAEKIVIGNTSGTNTGDQDLSGLAVKANNLSDLTNATTARSNLGLVIGTDVQAYNAALASIAGLTTAADKMIYTTASNTYAVADLSSVARTLIAQTSQSAMRSTGLGLGSLATLSTINNSNWSGTDLSVANGGTGASTLTGILKGNGTSAFTAVTAPSGTIVGTTDTQTLTNKTINGDNNTISNLAIGAEVTGASTALTDTGDITYNADTDVSGNGWVVDEDNMASNLATKVPTQQSVKAYVDTQIAATLTSEMTYKGGYNASTNTPDLDASPSGVKIGDTYTVTAAGTFFTTPLEIGDTIIATVDGADVEAEWAIVSKNYDVATTTTPGVTAFATTAETETGTEAGKAVTPDALHDMTTLAGAAWFLDEDNMASDSAVKTASQQSIKAYADTKRKTDTYTREFYTDGQNQLTSANIMGITAPYAGYMVAASVTASSARTAGTLDIQPHKDGTGLTATGLDLQLDDNPTTKHYATVAYGTSGYDFAAGDIIGLLATTTGWTPLADTFTVTLTIERA